MAHVLSGESVTHLGRTCGFAQAGELDVSCTLALDSECTAAAALVPATTAASGLRGP